MSNILRHASAKVVMITLSQDNREVCLQVIDDGQGFDMKDLSQQGPFPQKLGLLGIKERAELVGGRVVIDTSPGRGVRLQVCLPVTECKE
jgi:signal transduction histidine kinase